MTIMNFSAAEIRSSELRTDGTEPENVVGGVCITPPVSQEW
jgi:hypothetical protein